MSKYPKAIGPYSIYTIEGNILYTSGQLPVIPETGEIPEDFESQCRQSFANIAAILEEQKLDFKNVFKLTIYLSDLSHFNTLNQIMTELLEEPYPIRTAYQVAALPKDALIEVEAMARLTK
ncbi:Rid family detoxifying hydrolase [Streptococcus didelphis]|uniref:Rid family detoxifying hydrolase n=1 Tax=Streptococcus didelphis TaxID=102886 RepID=A0ABY9LJV6_9STRE|nr:Rid family detoxifying hydrolase [Streptococcus didelphis]WMB28391.1 Rid family detoxifying hydrolase [Streptococcus didelphis]WMB29074.1 Rid family detoxifying hydrolase [Streptococcus didelphis]